MASSHWGGTEQEKRGQGEGRGSCTTAYLELISVTLELLLYSTHGSTVDRDRQKRSEHGYICSRLQGRLAQRDGL